MKFVVAFLAVLVCAVAFPTAEDAAIDWSNLVPNNIYVEPLNPVEIPSVDGRVIGGTEAVPNSIPYQAALIINGNSLCGGSLISSTRVLTAAHCTIRASTVNVILGAHAFNKAESTQVRVTSTSVVNHAGYSSATVSNDIAVVFLPGSVNENAAIQSITLAAASAGTFEGNTALLSGWGRTSDASNAVSPVLRTVSLSVISYNTCRNVYGSFIEASTICTSGTGTVGACDGDSGGPLVVDGVQVGIVSFGSQKCEAGNPTVFARVSSFRSWIAQNAGV